MRYAFFSDVHANLPALEAVLNDIDNQNPDMVFCLGDLVGYAPWPNEVVSILRAGNIPTIAGNYDEGVGIGSDECGCAYKTDEDRVRGNQSITFTNEIVTDETRAFLKGLPRHMRIEQGTRANNPFSILMVHGSPRKINEYLFEDRPDRSFEKMMQREGADLMLFGHTHKPFWKKLSYRNDDGAKAYRHAVNLGSVGKPKDGDPRACYAVVTLNEERTSTDEDQISVEFRRVTYDVDRAVDAIRQSKLPDAFADMLEQAR